jgi:hypothetical protein
LWGGELGLCGAAISIGSYFSKSLGALFLDYEIELVFFLAFFRGKTKGRFLIFVLNELIFI